MFTKTSADLDGIKVEVQSDVFHINDVQIAPSTSLNKSLF